MNVRLYDGTVRCADCFDASSYVSETADPCTYCGIKGAPELIEVPVILYHPAGDTIGAYGPGRDAEDALSLLEFNTSDPNSIWFGWRYVALVDEEA